VGSLHPKTKHVAFHIWAAYSYSPNASWGALAEEFVNVKDDPEQLQTSVNTVLGQTWEDTGETVDEHMLFVRREHYAAQVPGGALLLTTGVNVQDDRFEIEVCGWGEGKESWSIDYIRLYGDLSKQTIWNILAERLRKQYRREDGVMLDVRLACIDSGGHFTDEGYQFSKKHGRRWAIPTKGANVPGKPIVEFRKPNKKGVYQTLIGADTAKEVVYRRFGISDPGAGYCHWPVRDDYDEEYFKQVTAEERMKKYSKGHAYYVWDAKRKRNEALDCRVLNLAAVRILQQHRGVDLARLGAMRARSGEEHEPPRRRSLIIKSNIHRRYCLNSKYS
jgi:phage terminase large subunit GpA-like protein